MRHGGSHAAESCKPTSTRFELLLETETDPTKRAMIVRLLAEEREKLKVADETPGKRRLAY